MCLSCLNLIDFRSKEIILNNYSTTSDAVVWDLYIN